VWPITLTVVLAVLVEHARDLVQRRDIAGFQFGGEVVEAGRRGPCLTSRALSLARFSTLISPRWIPAAIDAPGPWLLVHVIATAVAAGHRDRADQRTLAAVLVVDDFAPSAAPLTAPMMAPVSALLRLRESPRSSSCRQKAEGWLPAAWR